MKKLTVWFMRRRDRELEHFLATCDGWHRRARNWDDWQALERMVVLGSKLNFQQYLYLEMYRAWADIHRDLHRQLFGTGPGGRRFVGLEELV